MKPYSGCCSWLALVVDPMKTTIVMLTSGVGAYVNLGSFNSLYKDAIGRVAGEGGGGGRFRVRTIHTQCVFRDFYLGKHLHLNT